MQEDMQIILIYNIFSSKNFPCILVSRREKGKMAHYNLLTVIMEDYIPKII